MVAIQSQGVEPDAVYIDAAHDTASVTADVLTAARLWPGANLVGDDYGWRSVQDAIRHCARCLGETHNLYERPKAWQLYPKGGK